MFKNSFLSLLIFFFIFANLPTMNSLNSISLKPDSPNTDQISIPLMLNFQRKLTDNIGNPVPDSNYSITFRLFTSPTGGTAFWNETKTIETRSGLFHTLLGSVIPITYLPLDGNCYLEMQVNPNPAMLPRIRIVSSAYSYIAKKADSANYAQTAPLQRPITPPISTDEISDNAVSSVKILDRTIFGTDLNQMGATTGQVLKWTGTSWVPANDEVSGDNAWVRGTPDSIIYTIRLLGISRGGADNTLWGNARYTHINPGVACTTGHGGANYEFITIGGENEAGIFGVYATIGGGRGNRAYDYFSTISGGDSNYGSNCATIGGGVKNYAGSYATVARGGYNNSNGLYSTVAGGYGDTSTGNYSFTTNNHSIVPSGYSNSAAFNGQTATASNQLRCGTFAKAGGSFTIDHPIDPYNKILNHYFVECPEMLNIYRGSVILDANGKAEIKLPDYFSALNRNPHIQLTGVGTSNIYVLEDVRNNRFVIGGKPGTKVYWIVTGERTDVSAEVIRRLIPVEQVKRDELRGRMLDDEFLSGCIEQLKREGKANGINFRTSQGRKRYEDMKRTIEEIRRKGE